MTVYVRAKGNDHVDPPYLYIDVTTSEGVPTEPLNITATQLNGTRVQVSWEPPKETYGLLKEYVVYYRSQSISVQQAHSVRVSPDKTSIVLESNFEANTTYEFWVRARNTKNESPNSRLERLWLDELYIKHLSGLHVTHIGADSIQIEWDEIPSVDGYSIQTILPQNYPKIPPNQTKQTKFLVANLVQGVNINIKVSGHKGNFYGRPASISSFLPGTPLPEVMKLSVNETDDSADIRWMAPNAIATKNLTYGIYYGITIEQLYEKARITTQELQATIANLLPCESYLISVGIVAPAGPGPLISPHVLLTKYNELKPPRNVRALMNADKRQIEITWEHNCPLLGRYPASYTISLTELSTNKSKTVDVRRKGDKTLSHKFSGVLDGAVYNVSISTTAKDAEAVTLKLHAPALPPVRQIKVNQETNGSFVVFWNDALANDKR